MTSPLTPSGPPKPGTPPAPATPQPPKGLALTKPQTAGLWVFVLGNMFCASEMVPGWGMFHLDWPHQTFYLIAAASGLVSGALFGKRYVIPGMIGGALAGVGALATVGLYLDSVSTAHSALEALCALGGAVPGVAIGLALCWLQRRLAPDRTGTV